MVFHFLNVERHVARPPNLTAAHSVMARHERSSALQLIVTTQPEWVPIDFSFQLSTTSLKKDIISSLTLPSRPHGVLVRHSIPASPPSSTQFLYFLVVDAYSYPLATPLATPSFGSQEHSILV